MADTVHIPDDDDDDGTVVSVYEHFHAALIARLQNHTDVFAPLANRHDFDPGEIVLNTHKSIDEAHEALARADLCLLTMPWLHHVPH